MARQKRKKSRGRTRPQRGADAAPGPAARSDAGARPAPAPDAPPPPVWGDFPLVQLVVLGGLIVTAVGLFTANPTRVLVGLVLGSLGGMELAVREHFSGYRSHTTLLAGVGFAVTIGVTGYGLRWVVWICLLAGAVVFAVLVWLLRRRFVNASGGLAYRLR